MASELFINTSPVHSEGIPESEFLRRNTAKPRSFHAAHRVDAITGRRILTAVLAAMADARTTAKAHHQKKQSLK